MGKKILIVGAGFYGAVCARELKDAGHDVLVLEKRDHVGGACYTRYNKEAGCHQHLYGAHIFHTGVEKVWTYINRFAGFNNYVNRVKVRFKEHIYSFPINLFTLYQVFGVSTPDEAEACLKGQRIPCDNPQNLEDWCLSQIGEKLYEIFVKGYTLKQWQRDPKDLPASLMKRLPIRRTFDDNLFDHPYQGIPIGGYSEIFAQLLEGIAVETSTDFLPNREGWISRYDHVIYSGPLDAFFDFSEGALEYRSLRFDHELLDIPDFQGNAVFNYTEESVPFTRIIEHKHFDKNFSLPKTIITREYPLEWNPKEEPYYPIDTARNREILLRYQRKAAEVGRQVSFGGRLGEYKYYDMDQVILAALEKSKWLAESL
jgi:UDP-galactopyranose mutase